MRRNAREGNSLNLTVALHVVVCILCKEVVASPAGMYTAGLNPFYASNFSLWTAYCSGGFGVDSMKKPSFCIADILHVGDAENIHGSSSLMAHIGARAQGYSSGSPLRPSPVTPSASAYHRHGIHLTSRAAINAQSAPPLSSKDLKFGIDRILSTDFEPKGKESLSLRGKTHVCASHTNITSLLQKGQTIRITQNSNACLDASNPMRINITYQSASIKRSRNAFSRICIHEYACLFSLCNWKVC